MFRRWLMLIATTSVACQIVSGLSDLESGPGGGAVPTGGAGTAGSGGSGGNAGSGGMAGQGGGCCTTNEDCDVDQVCFPPACICGTCGQGLPMGAMPCEEGVSCEAGRTCTAAPVPECLLYCDGQGGLGDCGPPMIELDATAHPANLECVGAICDGKIVQCMGPFPCFVSCQPPNSCNGLELRCSDGPCTLECAAAGTCNTSPTLACGPNLCSVICPAGTTVTVDDEADSCMFNKSGDCTIR